MIEKICEPIKKTLKRPILNKKFKIYSHLFHIQRCTFHKPLGAMRNIGC